MKHFYSLVSLLLVLCFTGPSFTGISGARAQVYANAQTNSLNGLCLLCNVANPNNSVNANLTDYAQFNITAGLLGVSISQTLIFPATRNSGCDSLIIRIGSTNNVLSANLFGGITVQTFNGTTANSDATVIDSSKVRLLAGNTLAEIIQKPNQPFDRVKVTLTSSLLGLLTGLRIYFAYVNPGVPAAPLFAVPQGVVCGPQKLVVTNHTAGINYRVNMRYTSFTLPQPIDTTFLVINSDTITTPDPQTYIFLQANIKAVAINQFTGCISDTTAQAFIQGGYAELPAVGADSITICKGDSTTLYAYTPSSTIPVIRWYNAPAGGTLLYTGKYYAVAPVTTTTYYVTAALDCEHLERRPVKVIVQQLPNPVYSVPQGFVCGSSLLPVYNYQPGYNYNVRIRYTIFSSLLKDTNYVVHHTDTIPVPPYNTITGANATVYVQAIDTITGCRSDTVSMQFTIGGVPDKPIVSADTVVICHGDSAFLQASVPGSSLLQVEWFTAPSGGTLLFTGNNFTTAPGITTVYYAGSRGTCQNPSRVPVYVMVQSCAVRSGHQVTNISRHPSEKLTIFPNPSTGEVRLNAASQVIGGLLIITDINGKEQQRTILQYQGFRFNPNLLPGLYFLQITTPEGKKYTGKAALNNR